MSPVLGSLCKVVGRGLRILRGRLEAVHVAQYVPRAARSETDSKGDGNGGSV